MAVSLRRRIIVATVVVVVVAASAAALGLWRHRQRRHAQAPEGSAQIEPQIFDYKYDPRRKGGFRARPMDVQILEALGSGRIEQSQLPDLFPDKPYKVKLVYSPVERKIKIVAIDLDRDGKVDEVWHLQPGAVVRRLVHGDDPSLFFTLAAGCWIPH